MPSELDESTAPRSVDADGAKLTARPIEPSAFQQLGKWIAHAVGHKSEGTLKEALEEVLEEHEADESPIAEEERLLLRNMIAFGGLTVSDVMIPRADVRAVADDISLEELKSFIAEHRHTRIPVYNESLDHVRGFLHIKDLLMCLIKDEPLDVSALKRDILFVPSSMKIIDLLMKMRLSSCHMAIVVDEYGGTDGLVTMEDLFEEIVGEIQDEHDEGEVSPEMNWQSDRVLEADARVRVDDLVAEMNIDLINGSAADDFDTLGGLIFSHLGRIPARGEVVDYGHGVRFEILSADPRRIKKVRLVCAEPLESAL